MTNPIAAAQELGEAEGLSSLLPVRIEATVFALKTHPWDFAEKVR